MTIENDDFHIKYSSFLVTAMRSSQMLIRLGTRGEIGGLDISEKNRRYMVCGFLVA